MYFSDELLSAVLKNLSSKVSVYRVSRRFFHLYFTSVYQFGCPISFPQSLDYLFLWGVYYYRIATLQCSRIGPELVPLLPQCQTICIDQNDNIDIQKCGNLSSLTLFSTDRITSVFSNLPIKVFSLHFHCDVPVVDGLVLPFVKKVSLVCCACSYTLFNLFPLIEELSMFGVTWEESFEGESSITSLKSLSIAASNVFPNFVDHFPNLVKLSLGNRINCFLILDFVRLIRIDISSAVQLEMLPSLKKLSVNYSVPNQLMIDEISLSRLRFLKINSFVQANNLHFKNLVAMCCNSDAEVIGSFAENFANCSAPKLIHIDLKVSSAVFKPFLIDLIQFPSVETLSLEVFQVIHLEFHNCFNVKTLFVKGPVLKDQFSEHALSAQFPRLKLIKCRYSCF
ncbi:hypothetical protein P9112_005626 [Eukaryota sp. TZLM1-RC]